MKRQLRLIGLPFLLFSWAVSLSPMRVIADDKGENSGPSLQKRGSDSYWRNWLEQDVAYIITDEERAAFEKLTTDDECLQFTRQFWLRRDPAFTTLENESKNEHYRRLAYANEKYASATLESESNSKHHRRLSYANMQYGVDVPGWRTDRGKMHILLGPPDDVTRANNFSQIWHYGSVPGFSPSKEVVLEFVDKLRSQDYRLTDYRLTMDSTVEALLHWFRKEIHLQESSVQSLENRRWLGSISHPPLIRYKDLETVLNSKLNPDLFFFKYQTAFRKLTDATVLTSIGFQFQSRNLAYQEQSDRSMLATVNIFARVTDSKGYVWEEFEAQIKPESPEPFFKEMLEGTSYYQKAVALRAGLYNLELAVKDLYSGKVGTIYKPLLVPEQGGLTGLDTALSTATDPYEWARLSKEIDKEKVTVAETNAPAFVRYQLVSMSAADSQRREEMIAEIVALGQEATPYLILAITNAPRPVSDNQPVINLPFFSMQVLAKMRSREAVPAIIDFIDRFQETHFYPVFETLRIITGQDFGTDKAKWKNWYERSQRAEK